MFCVKNMIPIPNKGQKPLIISHVLNPYIYDI